MGLDRLAEAKSHVALEGMLRSLDLILVHWESLGGFESFASHLHVIS